MYLIVSLLFVIFFIFIVRAVCRIPPSAGNPRHAALAIGLVSPCLLDFHAADAEAVCPSGIVVPGSLVTLVKIHVVGIVLGAVISGIR